jgi:hypothetical protein
MVSSKLFINNIMKKVDILAHNAAPYAKTNQISNNPRGNGITWTGEFLLKDAPAGIIPLKFYKVDGRFDCSYLKLISLENSPRYVTGNFICRDNKLTSLVGGPEVVGGAYNCINNMLTSLEGAPKHVETFICSNNPLISLKGVPAIITGDFVSTTIIPIWEFRWLLLSNIGGEIKVSNALMQDFFKKYQNCPPELVITAMEELFEMKQYTRKWKNY